MHNAAPIYEFLVAALRENKRAALVTVTAVTGASSRNPGTHMAIGEDGSYAGSFSGGCIEMAVVAEAIQAIRSDTVREVRFGAGSRYIDIRLPCGGSVDLLFNPIRDSRVIAQTLEELRARRPASISLPRGPGEPRTTMGGKDWRIVACDKTMELTYIPALRVAIFGHGSAVEALQRSAASYGAELEIFTPDETIVDRVTKLGYAAHLLSTPGTPIGRVLDLWTAAIFLFHDHDWEPHLLKAALAQPSFFVGAMGSRITHEHRLQRLRELGIIESDLSRIVAPVGLIPSSRDPETLAISVLAQIVSNYHDRFMKNVG